MNRSTLSTRERRIVCWALLALYFCIGLLTLYKGAFVDEADNLTIGSVIAHGGVLYRDVFSHHFPFPYYWVAAVTSLFGASLFWTRLSLLVFQTVALALVAGLTGLYLEVGVTALIWSIIRPFYGGQMILYNSFASTSLLVVFISILAILQNRREPDWKDSLLIGVYSLIALLSDPLSSYACAVAFIFLATRHIRSALSTGLIMALGLGAWLAHLYSTGSASDFVSDAILFNAQIYSKYTAESSVRFSQLFEAVVTGLGINNRDWFNLNPFTPITGAYMELDRWFFTGFLYRFSVIVATVFAVARRQFRAAAFIYAYAAALLVINVADFRGQPFVLLAVFTVAMLVTGDATLPEEGRGFHPGRLVASVPIVIMAGWLCLWLGTSTYHDLKNYSYDVVFGSFADEGAAIRGLACDLPDVRLLHYPGGSYFYWFSGMKPATEYTLMWPWIAEKGQNEVIRHLREDKARVIVIVEDVNVWDTYKTTKYLSPLISYLRSNYRQVATGTYFSPELFADCPTPLTSDFFSR